MKTTPAKLPLHFSLALMLGLGPMLLTAAPIDPATPEGHLQISRKVYCSLEDGRAVTYTWQGRVYSRIPGERDRLLFLVEGMNVRQCGAAEDPKRGKGYRLVSREIMLYKDPASGEILRQWENPFTGQTLEVQHVANDPVNFGDYELDRRGKPSRSNIEIKDNVFLLGFEVPLFYPNPLAGDYQDYVGGTYHATEMFHFSGNAEQLLNSEEESDAIAIAWVRISQWLPWMKMGSRAGLLYTSAAGKRLKRWDDLSDDLKQEIKSRYAEYREPPPLDDQRRNATSWSEFKKLIDAAKQ